MWPGTWETLRTGSVGWDLKSQLVEFLARKKVDFRLLAEALWRVPHGVRGRWKSQVYLPPYVEKPFNSKVIKSFLPELRSRKCFCVSGFLCSMYICYETFYVRFTYPYHGYVTCRIHRLHLCWEVRPPTVFVFRPSNRTSEAQGFFKAGPGAGSRYI